MSTLIIECVVKSHQLKGHWKNNVLVTEYDALCRTFKIEEDYCFHGLNVRLFKVKNSCAALQNMLTSLS